VELDHVLIPVGDLATAARELERRHGLASIEGGRHPHWGTANRIVPLGRAYLELVTVVDETQAAHSTFGRWVCGGVYGLDRPLGWAVRTRTLDDVARRLGLTVDAGSRSAPGGKLLRWRSAGIEQAATEPSLPFFIEWAHDTPLPGRTPIKHRAGSAAIVRLILDANPDRLATWLGTHSLPIIVHPGTAAVAAVVVSTAEEEIVLGP
jgi:hypothetical protein